MARNHYQDEGILNWTNTTGSAVASGAVVKLSHTIGIALVAIAAGATGAVDTQAGRVYTVPKVSGAVFAAGEKLLYDLSALAFDDSSATPASGDLMGAVYAFEPGANGETTCKVVLSPGNATLTA